MFRKAKSASPACDFEQDMKALCRKRTMSSSVPLNNHVSRGMERVAKSWIVKKAFASARGSYCFSYSRKRHRRVSPSSLISPILPLLEPHKYFTLLFIHTTEWNSCSFTVFLNFPFVPISNALEVTLNNVSQVQNLVHMLVPIYHVPDSWSLKLQIERILSTVQSTLPLIFSASLCIEHIRLTSTQYF